MYLGWVFGAVSAAVCLIIGGLVLGASLRKRQGTTGEGVERGGDGLSWIYVGTGISTVVLFAMTIYMLVVLNGTARPAQPVGLTVTATGYDWWWKFDYGNGLVTANELHIPVGVPVLVNLDSADVIHAFWVPMLAGKTQMIPGQRNQQWIEADAPGRYRGQCTQFCGVQHAHMAFEVVAEAPEDFARWWAAQRQPAAPVDSEASAGQTLFTDQCSGCHAVRGTDAMGQHAPDLTHLASRGMIAAGLMPNTPDSRMEWIEHAQDLKPGARMPSFAFSPSEASALKAYLSTLE
jgi:cytochrome c oxidase subunit 2